MTTDATEQYGTPDISVQEDGVAPREVTVKARIYKPEEVQGCGTWYPRDGSRNSRPADWYECVIPHELHQGCMHVFVYVRPGG